MSADAPAGTTGDRDVEDSAGTEGTEPTPGSDNDGAEPGYTPPAGSDDPVSD